MLIKLYWQFSYFSGIYISLMIWSKVSNLNFHSAVMRIENNVICLKTTGKIDKKNKKHVGNRVVLEIREAGAGVVAHPSTPFTATLLYICCSQCIFTFARDERSTASTVTSKLGLYRHGFYNKVKLYLLVLFFRNDFLNFPFWARIRCNNISR